MYREVKQSVDGSLYFEKILPNGWILSDLDVSEHLFEFEFELKDVPKSWIPCQYICQAQIGHIMKLIFRDDQLDFEVPGEVIVGTYNVRNVVVTHFKTAERRNRSYLQIYFDFVEKKKPVLIDDEDLPF